MVRFPLAGRIVVIEKAGKYKTLLSYLYHKPHMLHQKSVADIKFTDDLLTLVCLIAVDEHGLVRCVYMPVCVHVKRRRIGSNLP